MQIDFIFTTNVFDLNFAHNCRGKRGQLPSNAYVSLRETIPQFARSLSPGIIVDFRIKFGHRVEITRSSIEWYRHGHKH